MLYISRYVFQDRFGVVDTDTGIERVVDCKAIEDELTRQDILGVSINEDAKKLFRFLQILPYQPTDTATILQAKTSYMKRVDVVVHKDSIASVTWYSKEIQDPVVIRLSDFGKSVGDCVFLGNSASETTKVICIVDDTLESVSKYALNTSVMNAPLVQELGVVFDLTEVKNGDIADTIYSQLFGTPGIPTLFNISKCVIDIPGRFKVMEKRYNGLGAYL